MNVDGKALSVAVKRMTKVAGPVVGAAYFAFDEELTITWSGMSETLPLAIPADEPLIVRIEADMMLGLGRRKAMRGDVELDWNGDRLRIGTLSLPGRAMDALPAMSLPMGAGDQELLCAMLRHSSSAALAAGYPAERVADRWHSSLDKAAQALAWTGLSRDEFVALVGTAIREKRG
jgi:hypothetical protein